MGFYQGDISLLMDDIKTLKPTFFPVVPRLLNRIYDKVGIRVQKHMLLYDIREGLTQPLCQCHSSKDLSIPNDISLHKYTRVA